MLYSHCSNRKPYDINRSVILGGTCPHPSLPYGLGSVCWSLNIVTKSDSAVTLSDSCTRLLVQIMPVDSWPSALQLDSCLCLSLASSISPPSCSQINISSPDPRRGVAQKVRCRRAWTRKVPRNPDCHQWVALFVWHCMSTVLFQTSPHVISVWQCHRLITNFHSFNLWKMRFFLTCLDQTEQSLAVWIRDRWYYFEM